MFCSTSVTVHLLRGLGAAALLTAALLTAEAALLPRIAAVLGAFTLMRGCPMCWTVGLFETVSRRRLAPRPPAPAADAPSPSHPVL